MSLLYGALIATSIVYEIDSRKKRSIEKPNKDNFD
jgi:hypothetical protein